MTKTQLARNVGLSVRSVTGYESGTTTPDAENALRLAGTLGFPESFFYCDDLPEVPAEAVSFRALSRLTAGKRDQAQTAATLALDVHEWIAARFRLPHLDLPTQLDCEDAECAAEVVRMEWGLGEKPIPHMVRLLEAHGVRVFSLAEEYAEVDAFSFWHNNIPFVFLNTMKSPERSRMDAAHELGHVILHRREEVPRGREIEKEAKDFASALLMPRAGILPHGSHFPTVDDLIRRKRVWKVSVAALAYRLHALEAITDWHYRSLYMDISRRGFRSTEPAGMTQRETSMLIEKVLASLRQDGDGIATIARDLHLPVTELSALMFGPVPLAGVGATSGGVATGERRTFVVHHGDGD